MKTKHKAVSTAASADWMLTLSDATRIYAKDILLKSYCTIQSISITFNIIECFYTLKMNKNIE